MSIKNIPIYGQRRQFRTGGYSQIKVDPYPKTTAVGNPTVAIATVRDWVETLGTYGMILPMDGTGATDGEEWWGTDTYWTPNCSQANIGTFMRFQRPTLSPNLPSNYSIEGAHSGGFTGTLSRWGSFCKPAALSWGVGDGATMFFWMRLEKDGMGIATSNNFIIDRNTSWDTDTRVDLHIGGTSVYNRIVESVARPGDNYGTLVVFTSKYKQATAPKYEHKCYIGETLEVTSAHDTILGLMDTGQEYLDLTNDSWQYGDGGSGSGVSHRCAIQELGILWDYCMEQADVETLNTYSA